MVTVIVSGRILFVLPGWPDPYAGQSQPATLNDQERVEGWEAKVHPMFGPGAGATDPLPALSEGQSILLLRRVTVTTDVGMMLIMTRLSDKADNLMPR